MAVGNTTRWVASAVADQQLSAIKQMAMLSAEVPDVASLAWGLPSFATPEHIRQAVIDALRSDRDIGKYALPNGLPELREQVAKVHRAKTGVEVDPTDNVLVTAGNMEGLSCLLRTIVEPGDEIIVTDPGFASHIQQIRFSGGVPVFWPLEESQGWRLSVERLPALISPRTKAVILVTPANPTGTIFAREDLLRAAEIIKERNILLFLDDPYSSFIYEKEDDHCDLASHTGLSDQLVYLFTFSKCHAMSGWRMAYMVLPNWLREQVLKVHDATMICAPRISQIAWLAALTGDRSHVEQFRQILSVRRDLIFQRLDRVRHVFEYVEPQGAYYVFPKILVDHNNAFDFSLRLLNEAKVAVTPGSAFGPQGENHVRLAFCVEEDQINLAFDRIEEIYPS
ncbi:MAG TPA: aminotransferase [Porticoccaceae bacterium]|nr:aminotransferase [Porticoccaceae bacterium]